MANDYLVQEEDGTSKIILEEGGGFIILEESTGVTPGTGTSFYVPVFRPRRRSK
jgi:hypothetical protein